MHSSFVAAVALSTALSAHAADGASSRLSFDVGEGLNVNSFLRDGAVSAHLVLRAGTDPRILVAFPAGNSGVGVWFAHGAKGMTWTLQSPPKPVALQDDRGRPLHGLEAKLVAKGGADLVLKQAVLSSIRVLRDYQALGAFPAEVAAASKVEGQKITWSRDRLDGAPGYVLELEVTRGTLRDGRVTPAGGEIALELTAAVGETPLTPIPAAALLNERARRDQATRDALTFLSYREKFLAGSWRFDTYFGRDTLMSVRLLMPALWPEAVSAGLGAVLTRLSPRGEVAHEEDIGEFAILDHLKAGQGKSDAPVFDYKMIDSSFMLAPVAAAWLLDDERGRTEAAKFLARRDDRHGEATRPFGADLVLNFRHVLEQAAPFAADPRAFRLISLKDGIDVGQWRDSNDGLGGGRFPYDVNAVFVPAALDAAARFLASGLIDPYLAPADRAAFTRASAAAEVWRAKAPPFFDVSIENGQARREVGAYARSVGVSDQEALRSLGDAPVAFHALSLGADAKPVRVVHTDEGFELLFGRPTADALRRALRATFRPFPAGLLTPVGVVVANPVFAGDAIQARLTQSAYHGTVIWSWQQAVLAAGLERQLHRTDLPPATLEELRTARKQLWRVIRAAHDMRNSELWSWKFAAGRFQIAPFGASAVDADESNAAQLWSTVYLAIPEP